MQRCGSVTLGQGGLSQLVPVGGRRLGQEYGEAAGAGGPGRGSWETQFALCAVGVGGPVRALRWGRGTWSGLR